MSDVFCAQTHKITRCSTIPEAVSLTWALLHWLERSLLLASPHNYLLLSNNFTSGCLIYCKLPFSVSELSLLRSIQKRGMLRVDCNVNKVDSYSYLAKWSYIFRIYLSMAELRLESRVKRHRPEAVSLWDSKDSHFSLQHSTKNAPRKPESESLLEGGRESGICIFNKYSRKFWGTLAYVRLFMSSQQFKRLQSHARLLNSDWRSETWALLTLEADSVLHLATT